MSKKSSKEMPSWARAAVTKQGSSSNGHTKGSSSGKTKTNTGEPYTRNHMQDHVSRMNAEKYEKLMGFTQYYSKKK